MKFEKKGPSVEVSGSAWRRTHSLLSPDERESIAICDSLHQPLAPGRGGPSPIPTRSPASAHTLAASSGTRTPASDLALSRFNYVIDFSLWPRYGDASHPSDCLNFSAPFLHFRVLLKGRHLETGPRAAGVGAGLRPRSTLQRNGPPGLGGAARSAAGPAQGSHTALLPIRSADYFLCSIIL